VILNGPPRSGKSSIAQAMGAKAPGSWVNYGVDASVRGTAEARRPGIGLRPGGERPDLEASIAALYAELFDLIAAFARQGHDVVVDVGLHESYSVPLHIQRDAARRLEGLPVLFVGVHCPLDVIWQRRAETWGQDRATAEPDLVDAVERWHVLVHAGHSYDVEVDTSVLTALQCADVVLARVEAAPSGAAFWRLDND
jgi:chloramphenicol 3-O phosphotransferase